MILVRLEPATLWSQVKHSTTALPRPCIEVFGRVGAVSIAFYKTEDIALYKTEDIALYKTENIAL